MSGKKVNSFIFNKFDLLARFQCCRFTSPSGGQAMMIYKRFYFHLLIFICLFLKEKNWFHLPIELAPNRENWIDLHVPITIQTLNYTNSIHLICFFFFKWVSWALVILQQRLNLMVENVETDETIIRFAIAAICN